MRNIKLIAGLAAFAVMALACGTGTEVTTGGGATGDPAVDKDHKPVAVPIGQKITVNTDALAATYTLSKVELRSRDEFGSKPENGTWLAAFLRVDVTKGETFACSCELSLVQKDGKVRDQAYASFDGRPEFESVDLKAGQNTDGWVMWDLPKSAVDEAEGARVEMPARVPTPAETAAAVVVARRAADEIADRRSVEAAHAAGEVSQRAVEEQAAREAAWRERDALEAERAAERADALSL